MHHRSEQPARSSSHLVCGRARLDEIGIRGFEVAQFPHEEIELGIGDLGGVEFVIEPVVTLDEIPQLDETTRYLVTMR
jgi:hypothetical protein